MVRTPAYFTVQQTACHRDERAALKPQINFAFAAQEKLLLIQCATQKPPETLPQGYHLWDRITSFCVMLKVSQGLFFMELEE